MGLQLTSTPIMKDWEVELRKESFYLYQADMVLYPHEGQDYGTVEISYDDLPKLKAAIALVEANRRIL